MATTPLNLPGAELLQDRSCPALVESLNKELPAELRVFQAAWIPPGADLVGTCLSREYHYVLPRTTLGPEPAQTVERLRDLLPTIIGTHCFANFTALARHNMLKWRLKHIQAGQLWVEHANAHRQQRRLKRYPVGTNVAVQALEIPAELRSLMERELLVADLAGSEDDDFICIRLVGTGFLYNMVRLVVGTLSAVARGTLAEEVLREALAGKRCVDLSECLAPAHGLLLYAQYTDSARAPWLPTTGGASASRFLRQTIHPEVRRAWHAWLHTASTRGASKRRSR